MAEIRCEECNYKAFREDKAGVNRWYCKNPAAEFARSECEPTPMICRTKRHSKELTIKTSPKWCPFRRKAMNNKEE